METILNSSSKVYTRPLVLKHQPIRFETAHCWNHGIGNVPGTGNGNGGYNNGNGNSYPNPPGPRPKQHP